MQVKDHVIEFAADGGISQRVYATTQKLRAWAIVLPYLDETALAALLAFWEDREGRAKPFKWPNPEDGTTYFVRFGDQQISVTRLNSATKAWSAAFTLQQAHDAEINNDEGI
jgi:phage-related protein